jgi:thiamine-monophosphate kinase
LSQSGKRSGEFEIIARYFAPLASDPGAFGLKDDVALVRPKPGHELVVKTDGIVESVHFFRNDPPASIAQKALRVNLSDLAAKGAEATGYLLTLALPSWVDNEWLAAFAQGLAEDQKTFGISLLGGDTDATPGPLTISVTALGQVAEGTMIRRSGASVGDRVFVSGMIGDGGAGLAVLKGEGEKLSAPQREALVARYQTPEPRLKLGQGLVGIASAALDVSDGLIADLGHIADASNVRIAVEASRVPMSDACRALWGTSNEAVARAATSGDDYEIAFTAPAAKRDEVLAAAKKANTRITEVGHVEKGQGVVLLDANGSSIPLKQGGFTHF